MQDPRMRAWSFFDNLDGPLKAAFDSLDDDDKSEAVDQLETEIEHLQSQLNAATEALEEVKAFLRHGGHVTVRYHELVSEKVDAALKTVGSMG